LEGVPGPGARVARRLIAMAIAQCEVERAALPGLRAALLSRRV
jgi:hypothetical protein